MTTPRIAPLEPPFAGELAAKIQRWMPPGSPVPPLALFRTLYVHPELADRMRPLGAGLLGHGLVAPRDREVVILRTCERAGAEYEWGVHLTAFGPQVRIATPGPNDDLLRALADELHDTARVTDATWAALAARYTPPQLLELIAIAGWYRLISYVCNAAAIPLEPWAATFTGAGSPSTGSAPAGRPGSPTAA
jgi:4-carboxymuconolactone decarboxylase